MTEIHYRKKNFIKINTIAEPKDEFNNVNIQKAVNFQVTTLNMRKVQYTKITVV